MKCPKCSKRLRAKYIKYDYSDKSGIANCILENVKEYTCKKCDETYIDLGSVDEINQQISNILLEFDVLTRGQLKFIRQQIFKMNYFEFAKVIDSSPQFIRELESHKRILGVPISEKIKLALFEKTQSASIILED